jgi:hypothetical protein
MRRKQQIVQRIQYIKFTPNIHLSDGATLTLGIKMTFEELSNKDYAQQLNEALNLCNQVPIHDNPCYTNINWIAPTAPTAPVPEPAMLGMMLVGLVMLIAWRRYVYP